MENSLSRKDNHRKSLKRNLITSLILYEQIKTTKAKAKAIIPLVEKILHLSKESSLLNRRRLGAYIYDRRAIDKALEVLGPRYRAEKTGLVKMFNLRFRLGDNAQMVMLKLAPGKEEILIKKDIKPKELVSKSINRKDKNDSRKKNSTLKHSKNQKT